MFSDIFFSVTTLDLKRADLPESHHPINASSLSLKGYYYGPCMVQFIVFGVLVLRDTNGIIESISMDKRSLDDQTQPFGT